MAFFYQGTYAWDPNQKVKVVALYKVLKVIEDKEKCCFLFYNKFQSFRHTSKPNKLNTTRSRPISGASWACTSKLENTFYCNISSFHQPCQLIPLLNTIDQPPYNLVDIIILLIFSMNPLHIYEVKASSQLLKHGSSKNI